MKTSRNSDPRRKKGDKKLFTQHMQEKLAVTVLVITLALFALVMVLYDIVKNNSEDKSEAKRS